MIPKKVIVAIGIALAPTLFAILEMSADALVLFYRVCSLVGVILTIIAIIKDKSDSKVTYIVLVFCLVVLVVSMLFIQLRPLRL